MLVITRTPLRVSLFGGGTDFPEFFEAEPLGGAVLSMAIDKYIYTVVKGRFDAQIRLGYSQTETVERLDDLQHDLIREALRQEGVTAGIELLTLADIPTRGSGLGSSGAVTVGVVHALRRWLGRETNQKELAEGADCIERVTLGRPIGLQDQYMAAYGGIRVLYFQRGQTVVGGVQAAPVSVPALVNNLMLFYTGRTRASASILTEQRANIEQQRGALQQMRDMAHWAHVALGLGDVDGIGRLLHEGWLLKKGLANGISNGAIDAMYEAARAAGAFGGKVCGAGGGGFLLVYAPLAAQADVRRALADYQELPFGLAAHGSELVRVFA